MTRWKYPFVELRCRSAFSFLRGASLPEDLVSRAAALDYDAIAIGDWAGVYGAPRAFKAATAAGVHAIVGAEVPVGTRKLYLLVEDARGYRNLCRLITRGKLRAPKGSCRLTWDDLEEHASGLVALTTGGVDGVLDVEDAAGALRVLDRLTAAFGSDRLYIEIQRHYRPDGERLLRRLVDLARHVNLPVVATNDVRYALPPERRVLDVLTCLRLRMTVEAAGRRLLANAERYLKPPAEMAALFRDLPDAVRNTRRIAERCTFTLRRLSYRFPSVAHPVGRTALAHLRDVVLAGARHRFRPVTARVKAQLERELAVIGRLELEGYFLIVWDVVEFCRHQGILVQGRGSAANSAVCYALGITAVDPIRMDLLFERFLSEERDEWPDIDLDLPSGERRERVLRYLYDRYGVRGAAMTANVITYRTRSAVREVGKALGLAADSVERLAAQLRAFEFRDAEDDLRHQLENAGLDRRTPRVRLFVDLVRRLQGLPRHLGQHSGGVVLSDARLDDVVPLEPATMPGRVVVQWDKDDCADLGILKVDILGLGMLAALEEAIPLVAKHDGVELDLAHLPKDDPVVYRMLQRADTIGVFQVESRAQMATLPRLQPRNFYDLVVEVAIVRPGPIVGKMVQPYLRRRAGREPIRYLHPSLEPVLRRTLGVPLFQEQLLRIAMTVAGFTGGEAEELRRAMGFKRSAERMKQIEARLRVGMAHRGIMPDVADTIVQGITSFALYGFPESHSASFALIAYASAYLKAHHPVAFYCAMLNAWPLGFYHPATLVKDAQRHGVRVEPIEVNRSSWRCAIERGNLRIGLRYVIGLREGTACRIEAERARLPFASLEDLVTRCGVREDERRQLARSGACAAMTSDRRDALWQLAALEKRPTGLLKGTVSRRPSPLVPMSPVEETLADYGSGSLTVGPHLLAHLRDDLGRQGVVSSADLRRVADGATVRVAGHVIVRQRPGTAKGMLFLTLEDEHGTCNAVVTPAIFKRYRRVLHLARLLVVGGIVERRDSVTHVRGHWFAELTLSGVAPRSRDFR